ncbi:MAG: hypothetical protein RI967_198 [Planctomycetota bacterium]
MMNRRSEADSLSTAALASLLVAASPAFAQDATDGTAGAKPGDVRLIEPRAQTIEDARDDAAPPPEPPAETLYNLGVARYREGDLAGAERLFRAAAERGRSEVAARAMFNEGTTAYAEVLRVLEAAATPPSPDAAAGGTPAGEAPSEESPEGSQENPLEQAIARLESGLRILKDAIRADPDNEDARVNAELAQRLLRQLRRQQEQQQQEQQQQDQQNQDQQNQDQQNQDQQNQDQQNQDQQDQDQQNQDQQNQDQQNQQQQNQDQQNQQQQNQDQQNQDQQNQDQQNQQQQQQQQSQEGQEKSESPAEPKPCPAEAQERKPLTREEIERLLQRVRLKEAQRLERQAQEERARRKPAPKDW